MQILEIDREKRMMKEVGTIHGIRYGNSWGVSMGLIILMVLIYRMIGWIGTMIMNIMIWRYGSISLEIGKGHC